MDKLLILTVGNISISFLKQINHMCLLRSHVFVLLFTREGYCIEFLPLNGSQYLSAHDDQRCGYEFRGHRSIVNGPLWILFRFLMTTRRSTALERFSSLMVEHRIFLLGHTCLFHMNVVFHFLFNFEECSISENEQSFL